ncbi:MAG: DUF2156 domain-containing protein [Marinobacter sp.]|nr:DUF2156 domain-containing protein [Marinobacter sp.]
MNQSILTLDTAGRLGEGRLTFAERVNYLKQYGSHSQSFSSLQPDMEYFDLPGVGYMGYMRKWGINFVLADPITAPDYFEHILTAYHQRFPNTCYIQVSRPVVDILHRKFGFFGTEVGKECRVDLASWNLTGKKKQILRTAINQAEKRGITVKERFSDDHTRDISEAWIKTRKCKRQEIRFMIRPMDMSYRENERHFYAYQDGRAVGFIYFDPIYANNQIISYVPNISRANADFKQGIFYTLMTHAMDVFKAEGVPALDLGFIPLSLDPAPEAQEARLLKRSLQLVYERGTFLYNFKGLEFTKSRFRGETTKTYCCHRGALPWLEFLAMLKLTRVA